MIESFWGGMPTELLSRYRWTTRIELANAIFEYLEIFHNRQRRYNALGMLTQSSTNDSDHSDRGVTFRQTGSTKPRAHRPAQPRSSSHWAVVGSPGCHGHGRCGPA